MTRIYAFVNQKGGVGKTTTAINLGAYLDTNNQQVLLVDLDAQGNATACLGVERKNINAGTYNLLINPSTRLHANTMRSEKLGISLIPSSPALAGAEVELVNEPDRANRLKQALSQASRYDYVLIDCPPSLGLLTLNAMTAVNNLLIPMQCEFFALEGLSQLMTTVQRVRENFNPGLQIQGLLLTMYDQRNRLSKEVEEDVRSHFGSKVYDTVIPRNVRVSEAPSHGKPILLYDHRSSGARAYMRLVNEIRKRDGVG